MTAKIGSLNVDVTMETARFKAGARQVRAEASGLEKSLGGIKKAGAAILGAVAATGIVDMAIAFKDMGKAALDAAGGLGEAAAAVGVSTTALQEYRYAATQVGLSTEEMDKGLEQLTRRLGDAALGVKEPAEALKRLGISLDDIKGKDAGDVIPLIAEGMKGIPDPAQRAAIAVDLFGRAGQKMATLLGGGAAGVNELRKAAQELGIVMTESEIAKADEAADKLAALNAVIEAQSNRKLAENADAILAYEEAVGNFKLGLITAIGDLENANQRYNAWALNFNAQLRSMINGAVDAAVSIPARLKAMGTAAVASLQAMVTGIRTWVVDRLNAVWNGVTSRIDAVAAKFKWLDKVVVRNSYIPDMVDSIGQHMDRLDGALVKPAKNATEAAGAAFRKMGREVSSLLDRIFPEVARAREFAKEAALIANSGLSPDLKGEAQRRLYREDAGLPLTGRGEIPLSFDPTDTEPLVKMGGSVEELTKKIKGLGDKAKETTVRVAKTFKDMANETLSALSRLSDAIKGGGFLSILEGIVGLGIQLGSIGAFGKTIQGRINSSVPGYASGGYPSRGLALVGERGPELVNFRGGERVFSNADSRGMMQSRVQIVPSPYFDVVVDGRVQRAAPGIAGAGAQLAGQTAQFQRSRRLA